MAWDLSSLVCKNGIVESLVGDNKAATEALRIWPGKREAFLATVPSFAQAALMPERAFQGASGGGILKRKGPSGIRPP